MKKTNNNKLMYAGGIGITIAFALFIAFSYTATAGTSFWGGIQELIAGKSVDKIFSESPDFSVDDLNFGAFPGGDIYNDVAIHGTFTQGGGCLATSTTASNETLLESDLLNYNCFLVDGEDDAMTLTLPATSTMTSLLKYVGDTREWLFYFATTTTATLTIAAGAGIDLVAVTADNDVIDHTEYAELKCTRIYKKDAALDVVCIVSELLVAD